VLFGISLSVQAGEVVALLGRNGMGKTTTNCQGDGYSPANRRTGALRRHAPGRISPYRIARLGLGLVPEGGQVFPDLTVHENLVVTASACGAAPPVWSENRVLGLFPPLRERRQTMAALLSGGKQPMLAISRALTTNPRMLTLDEATEGPAPLVRPEIWRVPGQLKRDGMEILLVDKNIADAARLADRHYILEKGRVIWTRNSADLIQDQAPQTRYLGV
jgi:branched-chain amino acid transport system ATP-binding protein